MNPPTHCVRCGRPQVSKRLIGPIPAGTVRHCGRGLCSGCYSSVRWTGPDCMAQFDRSTRRAADVWTDYQILRARHRDLTVRQAADLLGMTYAALERALSRHRTRSRTEGTTEEDALCLPLLLSGTPGSASQ